MERGGGCGLIWGETGGSEMEEGDRDRIKNVRKKIYFLRVKSSSRIFTLLLIPFINFFSSCRSLSTHCLTSTNLYTIYIQLFNTKNSIDKYIQFRTGNAKCKSLIKIKKHYKSL